MKQRGATEPSPRDESLTILQVHNVQSRQGGADIVLERERELLSQHGHAVPRFVVRTDDALRLGRARSALKAIWNREAVRGLEAEIEAHRPDVVHVHTPFPILSPAIFRAAKGRGIPTVFTLHSYRFSCVNGLFFRDGRICQDCLGKRSSWPAVVHKCYHGSRIGSAVLAGSLALHHAIGTFARHVDLYLALNEFGRRMLIEEGFPAEKVVVKPNFVFGPEAPGPGGGRYAMFVGRLVAEKGSRTVVEAWRHVGEELRLVVVGDGPLLPELQEIARELSHVELHRWKENDEVLEMMKSAEFVVFGSEHYEAGPLVLMESFACGTPVVVSDVGNLSELVQAGSTGVRFRSGDPGDLAAQVTRLSGDRELLLSMRANASREYRERYSPEANYDLLMNVYHRVMDQRTL